MDALRVWRFHSGPMISHVFCETLQFDPFRTWTPSVDLGPQIPIILPFHPFHPFQLFLTIFIPLWLIAWPEEQFPIRDPMTTPHGWDWGTSQLPQVCHRSQSAIKEQNIHPTSATYIRNHFKCPTPDAYVDPRAKTQMQTIRSQWSYCIRLWEKTISRTLLSSKFITPSH